ncbi:MAG: aspartate kinase [Gemmataceae bacterium]|nr:aspartate kinase [Gemmataceae bacterium]
MRLVVQKFGGSSVANAEGVMAAARKAIRAKRMGNQVIVVVSARGDTTDNLIELAREITEKPPAREMDMLLSTGEQISIALMAMAIQSLGEKAISFTGAQVGIVTDSTHTKARIKSISTSRMRKALEDGQIVIVAGFQGMDEDFNITTLGRGGSDTTAVALAAVMKHDSQGPGLEVACDIFTDVDGVYTTDPRIVPEARKMEAISYDEMLELASVGAGVMHSRSIEFAKKFDVPLQVRSSFSDSEGTWIVPEKEWMTLVPVCGAAMVREEARISIEGVPDKPGISHQVFNAVSSRNIVVDMIAQSVGTNGKANIGFTVHANELSVAVEVLQPLADELGAKLFYDAQVSKVSVVGAGMRSHTGVAEKMFAALVAENINLRMITTGDIKISVLVNKEDADKALGAVHRAFNLEKTRAQEPASPPATTNGKKYGRDLLAITQQLASMEEILVSNIHASTDQGRITLFGLPDRPGNCLKIFQAIAGHGIVVDMIVQNLSGEKADLSFSVPIPQIQKALELAREVAKAIGADIHASADSDNATLYVLGVGMRSHTGVARKIFGTLAQEGINILMINTSETCISVVVSQKQGELALASLRAAFGLDA